MIKYKILNKLFDWDYVAWGNNAASGVARVHTDKEGRAYYWRHRDTKVLDYIEDIYSIAKNEEEAFGYAQSKITWLTCSPDKYIKTITTE